MEEASGKNSRTGAFSYIGDDGKVYTTKWEAGVNEDGEPEEYDYEYYEDVADDFSPFVNPYDPTHQHKSNLAGHLAGVLADRKRLEPVTDRPGGNPLLLAAL